MKVIKKTGSHRVDKVLKVNMITMSSIIAKGSMTLK